MYQVILLLDETRDRAKELILILSVRCSQILLVLLIHVFNIFILHILRHDGCWAYPFSTVSSSNILVLLLRLEPIFWVFDTKNCKFLTLTSCSHFFIFSFIEFILHIALVRLLPFGLKSLTFQNTMQAMPPWWVWYYWLSPVAWTLNGLVTSQLGDVETVMEAPNAVPVKDYIEDFFGYNHDWLGYIAAVLIGFCLLFWSVFAFSIKYFNFQKR